MKRSRIVFSAIAIAGLLLVMLAAVAAGNSYASDHAGDIPVQTRPQRLLPASGALPPTVKATENAGLWSLLNGLSFPTLDPTEDSGLLQAKRGLSLLLDKNATLLRGLITALRPEAYYPVRQYDDYYFGFTGEDPARDHNAFSLCVIASPLVRPLNNQMQLVTILDARTNNSFIGLGFSF